MEPLKFLYGGSVYAVWDYQIEGNQLDSGIRAFSHGVPISHDFILRFALRVCLRPFKF
jgi:hypothetical protein